MIATKKELDEATLSGCDVPGCDCATGPMYFHCKAHNGGPIEVSYVPGSGVLEVECRLCKKRILAVKLAEK